MVFPRCPCCCWAAVQEETWVAMVENHSGRAEAEEAKKPCWYSQCRWAVASQSQVGIDPDALVQGVEKVFHKILVHIQVLTPSSAKTSWSAT